MGKHITFMGGTMRLSLFAAASLAVIAGFASPALAANECGDPGANGATADTFACTGTIPSISYSTNGNLTLTLTNGPTVTTGGISITGAGANTVTINRSDATAGAGDPSITSTSGAGIQATTSTGALVLTLTDGDFTGEDTPLAITGATAGVQLQSGATTATALNLTFTNGSITATGPAGVGVLATGTSVGAGNVILSLGGSVSGATGVRASTSGTGAVSIQASAVSGTVAGGDIVGLNGAAIQITPGGLGNIGVQAGRTVRATNATGAVIEVTNINATRNANVNNSGTIRSNDTTEAGYGDLAILVAGGAGNSSISGASTGEIRGRISLLNTGTASIAVSSGIWHTTGVTTIGGASSIGSLSSTNSNSGDRAGMIATNAGGAATTFAFGDGADTFTHGGLLALGEGAEAPATLLITGLETWSNGGRVLFGVGPDLVTTAGRPVASDGVANDRIVAQGAAFNGTTSSTPGLNTFNSSYFIMDADFSADQADCSAAVTADCLDLRGGGAVGSTPIKVMTAGSGFAERLVLVDASGAGTSEATAFTLSEESQGYRLAGATPVIESGMFLYTLDFDATAKQYALVASEFGGRSFELARFGRAVSEPWRTATGLWHDRQADLRQGGMDDATGVWLKAAGNFITESGFATSSAGVEYETSVDQRTTALVGGVDLMRGGGEDSAWVLGLTAGKLNSTLDFTARPSELDMDGYSFGAYASLVGAGFFLDGIVNHTSTDLTHNDMGQTFELSATALGYQVEGGYRLFETEGGAYVEPLAAVSYVKADIDDLAMGPIDTRFEEAKSLRGSLGLRFAGHVEMESTLATFSFTGRAWEEFEGENRTSLAATFASASVIDAGPSSYGDVGVALGLFGLGDRFSANLAFGVKFAEDYQSTDASFGFRVNW